MALALVYILVIALKIVKQAIIMSVTVVACALLLLLLVDTRVRKE